MSGTITPTVWLRSVRSVEAAAFRTYRRRALALRILSRSAADTGCAEPGSSARDTVDTLTPTARATSFSVGRALVRLPGVDAMLLRGLLIGMHELAGLQLVRPHHDLLAHVLELADVVAADILELGVDDPRLHPFAVRAERDRADDRVEGVL